MLLTTKTKAMKYEVIYTRTITKVVEIDQHSQIGGVADENCPKGYDVEDWCHIQDEEHLMDVLADIKAQELLS